MDTNNIYFQHVLCNCVKGDVKFYDKVLNINGQDIQLKYQLFEKKTDKTESNTNLNKHGTNNYFAVKTLKPIDYDTFLQLIKNKELYNCVNCNFDKFLTIAINKIKSKSNKNKTIKSGIEMQGKPVINKPGNVPVNKPGAVPVNKPGVVLVNKSEKNELNEEEEEDEDAGKVEEEDNDDDEVKGEIDDKTKQINEEKKSVTINIFSCTHHFCNRCNIENQDLVFTYNSKMYLFNHSFVESSKGYTDITSKVKGIKCVDVVSG